jgi:MFS family permease
MTNLVALLAGFALYGAFVLVPNYAETPRGLPPALARIVHYGFGATPTHAGLLLVPGTITGFLSGPLAGILGRRLGSKWPLALGMLLGSAGIGSMAMWHAHPWQIAVGMLVLGAGLPMTFAAMAKLIVDAVRPSETGVAAGVNTVMRTIGGVIGGQAGAAILASDTIPPTGLPAQSAFVAAFWMSAVAALVAVGIAVLATPSRARSRLAVAEAVD